jgi:predicted MFS family arabinose efflux permease
LARSMHIPVERDERRAVLAGFSAVLVGVGLARFAYTPMLPVLIHDGWLSEPQGAYIGAANLAGYLLGAGAAARLALAFRATDLIAIALALSTASFFACAFPISTAWLFAWRLTSGITGGTLMVLAASLGLSGIPASRRGVVGGFIFAGVGAGVLISSAVVPMLLEHGLRSTWIVLGLISLPLAIAGSICSRNADPRSEPEAAAVRGARRGMSPPRGNTGLAPGHCWPVLAYGVSAVGLVPHMIFFADHVARSLSFGAGTASMLWTVFGVGALAGPVLAGRLGDLVGFRAALHLAFAAEAAGVALVVCSEDLRALVISAAMIGALTTGAVPVVLGRIEALAGSCPDARRRWWGHATASFAVGQAAGGYFHSWLFATYGSHELLFMTGLAALLAALSIDVLSASLSRSAGNPVSRSPRGGF